MIKQTTYALAMVFFSTAIYASQASISQFGSGEAATATSVNTALSNLVTAINDNDSRITALETAPSNNSVSGRTYKLVAMGVILRGDSGIPDATVGNYNSAATLDLIADGNFTLTGLESEGELTVEGSTAGDANVIIEDSTLTDAGSWVQTDDTVVLTFNSDSSTLTISVALDGSVIIAKDFSFGPDNTYSRSESSLVIGVEI